VGSDQVASSLASVLRAPLLAAQITGCPGQPALAPEQSPGALVALAVGVHRQVLQAQVEPDQLALAAGAAQDRGRGPTLQSQTDVPVAGLLKAGHRADPAQAVQAPGPDPDLADPGQADPARHDRDRALVDGVIILTLVSLNVGLSIAQATLTGESVPQTKQVEPVTATSPIGWSNVVFAGTNVVGGRGIGLVVATDARTQFGETASLVRGIRAPSDFQGRRWQW
jgi:hypothetical protein